MGRILVTLIVMVLLWVFKPVGFKKLWCCCCGRDRKKKSGKNTAPDTAISVGTEMWKEALHLLLI
jgi:hypothetical protein